MKGGFKMNDFERMHQRVPMLKASYPEGTRLELISMDDPYSPIPSGTRGTVKYVDDIGQIGMEWDNGSSLSLVPDEDSFRKLTNEEVQEEMTSEDEISDDQDFSMKMF